MEHKNYKNCTAIVRISGNNEPPIMAAVYDCHVKITICTDGGYKAVLIEKGEKAWRYIDFQYVAVWNEAGERLV